MKRRILLTFLAVLAVIAAATMAALAATEIREGRASLERRTALTREQLQGALARGQYEAVVTAELPMRLRDDPVVARIQQAARDSLDAVDDRRRAARSDSLIGLLDTLPETRTQQRLDAYEALVGLRPTDAGLRAERDRLRSIVRNARLRETARIRALRTQADPGGSINLVVVWRNLASRPVTRARFWVRPVDGSGDVVRRLNGESSLRTVEQATTVGPGQVCCRNHYFRGLWRDPGIRAATLERVELFYANGATERIQESELPLIGW